MTEPVQEKKIWRFIERVEAKELEGALNALAAENYQVFRIDRIELAYGARATMDVMPSGRGHVPDSVYSIVAFDAVELGSRSAASMTAALQKVVGLPSAP